MTSGSARPRAGAGVDLHVGPLQPSMFAVAEGVGPPIRWWRSCCAASSPSPPPPKPREHTSSRGVISAVALILMWALLPLYGRRCRACRPARILAHPSSGPSLPVVVITFMRGWGSVRAL